MLQIKNPGSENDARLLVSDQMTLYRLSHVVEDVCQSWPNTLAMVVRPGELCIFTSHESRNRSHERISLQEMGEAILAAVRSQSSATARIGVSESHRPAAELLEAYHQACSALESGNSTVSFFEDPAPRGSSPVEILGRLVKAVQQGKGAMAITREFLAHAMPSDHSSASVSSLAHS